MTRRHHFLFGMLLLVAMLALLACSKHYLQARSAHAGGITVQPMQVWVGGHKLWVRVTVINDGAEPIVVTRDLVTARLPGGQTVGRASGAMTQHNNYVIPPNGSHAVYVEFAEQGFDWDTVPQVTVDFTQAIRREGRAVPVTMLVVQ